MCRYAFSGPYREPYTCFNCCKVFHATMEWDRTKRRMVDFPCPECKQPMHGMGLDFKAPRQQDIRQWRKVKMLYENGFTYHNCGCGAGRQPQRLSEVKEFLKTEERIQTANAGVKRRWAKDQVKEDKRKGR